MSNWRKGLPSNDIVPVILINCLLALVAFAKDLLLAAYLGTSELADTFALSHFLVDTLGNNLLAAALGVACIPILTKLCQEDDHEKTRGVLGGVLAGAGLAGMVLALLLSMFGPSLYAFLGSGISPSMRELGSGLLLIQLPLLVVFPAITVGIALLQVRSRFVSAALGPVFYNVIFLLGLILLLRSNWPAESGIYGLTGVIGLAVIGQCLFIWLFAGRSGPAKPLFTGLAAVARELREVLAHFLPYSGVLASAQIIYTAERYVASGLGTGYLAALNYAFRLVQFPNWVFTAAVVAVAFPEITRRALQGNKETFSAYVYRHLELAAFFTVPLAILFYVLRHPIIQILFERGEFNAYSVDLTATLLSGYIFWIIGQGFVALLIRVALAKGRQWVPLQAGIGGMAVNLVLLFVLVGFQGAAGLGQAAAWGALVNAGMLIYLLRQDLVAPRGLLVKLLPFTGANLAVLAACLILKANWTIPESGPIFLRFGTLLGIILLVAVIYLASFLALSRVGAKVQGR